jgi:hypothetical protein
MITKIHTHRALCRLIVSLVIALGAMASRSSVAAEGQDPESIIRAIHQAMEGKDVEAALALMTDEIVVKIVPPPPGTSGVWSGKEEVRGWLEGTIAQNFASELSNFQVEGNRATWTAMVSLDDWRALGIEALEHHSEGVFENGKLKYFTTTMTQGALDRLMAALSAPQTLPKTGAEKAPVTLWLLVAFGGAALIALGLALAFRTRRAAGRG